ncbi:MAG: isoprenylcysteine carboxylmethyltransferase family protein [Candidatus Sericytochromatia bacterium]|nr:isoprenylcysteine carboxylmethyltransferase family protein [Candidatus Sericytochromatia bacterium]
MTWQLPTAAILLALWLPGEVLYRLHGAVRTREDRHSSHVLGLALTVSLSASAHMLWTGLGRVTDWPLLSSLGFIVALGGMALRYWAIQTLGAMFTSAVHLRADHRLVETGPFRWIRHPGYAGTLAFLVGMACGLENPWLAAALLAIHGLAYAYRIHVEEACLRDHFGEAYGAYAARTWRLLPYVY